MANDENKYDRPWTEEEWFAEFRRNDVRTAKFEELLETFADDPDCDDKIDHEMGWDKDDGIERPWLDEFNAAAEEIAREEDEKRWLRDDSNEAGDTDEPEDADKPADAADSTDGRNDVDDDDLDPDYGPLTSIPAYAFGMDLAVETVKLAKGFPEMTWKCADHHELFVEAVGNTFIPAAKLARGHSYGYDEKICANIVNNRIALTAVEKSLANFAELEAAGTLPGAFREKIVPRLRELHSLLVERIATMRKRVWW